MAGWECVFDISYMQMSNHKQADLSELPLLVLHEPGAAELLSAASAAALLQLLRQLPALEAPEENGQNHQSVNPLNHWTYVSLHM